MMVFSSGMARFYLVIPLDRFICPPDQEGPVVVSHNNGSRSHTHSDGHTHDHGPSAPVSSEQTGYTITHCKDTVNGIALTPHQPLGTIIDDGISTADMVSFNELPPAVTLVDSFVPAPFQPPRA